MNAAADMLLLPGLLLVASCFHGRAVSSNTPYKSERPFTVVVQVWDTQTWQLTRLVSPRCVGGVAGGLEGCSSLASVALSASLAWVRCRVGSIQSL